MTQRDGHEIREFNYNSPGKLNYNYPNPSAMIIILQNKPNLFLSIDCSELTEKTCISSDLDRLGRDSAVVSLILN
jgi:hypothetical protein